MNPAHHIATTTKYSISFCTVQCSSCSRLKCCKNKQLKCSMYTTTYVIYLIFIIRFFYIKTCKRLGKCYQSISLLFVSIEKQKTKEIFVWKRKIIAMKSDICRAEQNGSQDINMFFWITITTNRITTTTNKVKTHVEEQYLITIWL